MNITRLMTWRPILSTSCFPILRHPTLVLICMSIKVERKRRTAKYQVIGGRAIPPWKTFLVVNANKISLRQYLNSYVLKNAIKCLKVRPTICMYNVVGITYLCISTLRLYYTIILRCRICSQIKIMLHA